jgi:hypothetical protein
MAEKPTNPPLPYLLREREGTKIDPELAEVLKLLAERGKPVTIEGLKALLDPVAAAQKRAVESDQVDDTLANQWFREHWKDRTCPICRQVSWAMAPTFGHISMGLAGRHVPASSFPCVVLSCRVCGNTVFFNAVAMKLLPDGAE